jgi:hypothetical protein
LECTPPDRLRVLESYQDGTAAIRAMAARCPDWNVPTPCADWQAIDLAGHLRCAGENYLEFLQDALDTWDRTHFIHRGTKYTVGDHVGAASVEWHLHAWDLARAIGADYRPRDPDALVSAWRWGVPHLPLASGDSWHAVLVSSGRSPHWPDAAGRRPRIMARVR